MYIVLKSAFAAIKQKKAQTVLIGIIIFLVSGLLYLGISMVIQNSPFEEMMHRANAGETIVTIVERSSCNEQIIDWYNNRDEVEGVLVYEADMLTCKHGENDEEDATWMFVAEYNNDVYDILYIDENTIAEPPKNDDIIMNYNYANNHNLEIGDTVIIVCNGKELVLTISQLVVDPQFSNPFISPSRCFVASGFFSDNNITNQMQIIEVKYHDVENINDIKLFEEFTSEYDGIISSILIGYNDIKLTYSIIYSIIAGILIAVSGVIFLVVVLIIRSTIQNIIRQKYRQIGVQKAIGYKVKQIRGSLLLVYCIIGIISALLGGLCALPIRNLINKSINYDLQLSINSSIDIFLFINLLTIISLLALFTFLATKKAVKVKPVQAIKYGRAQHTVGRTKYSINGKRSPLSIILSIKHILSNSRKTLSLILLLIMLAYGGYLIRNIGTTIGSEKHFASNMFGLDIGDFAVQIDENKDLDDMIKGIKDIEGVSDVIFQASSLSESFTAKDGISHSIVGLLVAGNFEDHVILSEGRPAVNDNEIVISDYASIDSGRGVGDYITILNNDGDNEYLVTGIYSSVSNGGYSYSKKVDVDDDRLQSSQGYFWGYFDNDEIMLQDIESQIMDITGEDSRVSKYDGNVSSLLMTVEAFPMVTSIMLFVFLLVGGISLLNATIIDINNSVKTYGIMKSIGFSKAFISRMLVIRSLMVVLIGMVIGFILNILSMNSVMAGIFKMTPYYTIRIPVLCDVKGCILISILFIIIGITAPLIATKRLDKISPKQLIAE